jgi:hypothetical protein
MGEALIEPILRRAAREYWPELLSEGDAGYNVEDGAGPIGLETQKGGFT